jgi:hypothetical protein
MAVLRMPSIVVSCRLLSTPRWVAWYLDFRSCSTTKVLYGGPSLRFVRALDNLWTSLVMCMKCSLKSSSGLMCTPNFLYDFFGGRYVMWNPSRKDIVLICS